VYAKPRRFRRRYPHERACRRASILRCLSGTQSRAANGSKCWNWFEAAHQQRDSGEPSIIAGLTRQILDSYRIDPERVYIAGLSAGGAMALTLAMTHPDLYAAVGIHSGLPHAVAKDLPSALGAMKSGQVNLVGRHSVGASGVRRHTVPIPAIVFHGDRDTTVHPCNGDQVIAQCVPAPPRRETPPEGGLARQMSVMQGKVPHGHAYTRTTYHNANGQPFVEHWLVHGAGHAWSGGSASGSYTDPKGPDASREMFHFFYHHPQVMGCKPRSAGPNHQENRGNHEPGTEHDRFPQEQHPVEAGRQEQKKSVCAPICLPSNSICFIPILPT
jgi:poly(hydroxyalkanoate) depolymerase family esterase